MGGDAITVSAPAAKPAASPPLAPAAGGGTPTASVPPAPVRRKRPRVDWKAVWPIPLALAAAAGLTFGLFTAVARAPKEDPAVPLTLAHNAYDQSKYTDALEIINADLVPYINAGKLSAEQEKDFFALRARSLYYGQERMGISQVENYRAIVEAYEQGRRRGMAIEPADIGNLAESYLFTGEVQKAVDLARKLEGRDEPRRLRLYERMAKQLLKEGPNEYPLVLNLLNEVVLIPGVTVEQKAWAVSRQAQIALDNGFPEEAITRLLRELPKFESLPNDVRADLLFILGKAYAEGVDDSMAMTTLEQAMRCLLGQDERKEGAQPKELVIDRFDPRIGEALVIQGRIFARNNQVEQARERFQTVRESFKDSNVYAQALLGEADTSAELNDYDGALSLYTQAADRIASSGATSATPGIGAVTLDLIGTKLMDQHDRRVLENDPVEALRFVRKAQEVYQRLGVVPSNVYLAMAKACRLNAQIMLRDASGTPANEPAPRPEDVSPAAAAEAKGYLLDAGQNFRSHAHALGGVSQHELYLESLLAAGDCFDQAGDAPSAIDAYSSFLSATGGESIGVPEAKFRLAQVYQSTGEFATAARYYKELIAGGRAGSSGKWADMSLVPLARCYVSEPSIAEKGATPEDKPNEREAIALLTRAVSGRAGLGPEAPQMREAQVELAELHYRRGEFREAIELFNRLVDSYHDQTPRLPTVLFKRADAHRQLAMRIIATQDQRPLAERNELQQAQTGHLRDARIGYQEALVAIAKRGPRATPTEKLYQRNATFYTADCAYLLGQFEQAVQEYARAGEQYASDPASLVAKVQTVSAFIKLERWDDAQVAAERAKSFLGTIPEDSWNKTDALFPMERKHWEAWLAARLELDRHFKTASAGGSAP